HGALDAAPLGIGGSDVESVARAAAAEQRTEPLPSRLRLAAEEHESRRLAQEETTPPPVEGADALAREGPEAVEAAQHERAQDVGAARAHRVRLPAPQEFGAQSKRSGSGGAGRGHRDDRSSGAQPATERVAGRIVERAGKAPRRAGERALAFLDAADPAAHDHRQPAAIPAHPPLP